MQCCVYVHSFVCVCVCVYVCVCSQLGTSSATVAALEAQVLRAHGERDEAMQQLLQLDAQVQPPRMTSEATLQSLCVISW
jgi:hypothetical protein